MPFKHGLMDLPDFPDTAIYWTTSDCYDLWFDTACGFKMMLSLSLRLHWRNRQIFLDHSLPAFA